MNDSPIIVSVDWNGVADLVGREFRSSYLQVDQAHLDLFDAASYVDKNANAMNADFYQDGLVEGFHLLALLDHLTNSVLSVDDPAWAGWNYGFDHIRFVSEVTTRDRIRVMGAVKDVTPRGDRYLLTLECAIEVEGRAKPGAVMLWKVLWARE